MQDKLIKFKSRKEELQHHRNILYIDLTSKLKQLNNKKIQLCKTYKDKVKIIDEEIQGLKNGTTKTTKKD